MRRLAVVGISMRTSMSRLKSSRLMVKQAAPTTRTAVSVKAAAPPPIAIGCTMLTSTSLYRGAMGRVAAGSFSSPLGPAITLADRLPPFSRNASSPCAATDCQSPREQKRTRVGAAKERLQGEELTKKQPGSYCSTTFSPCSSKDSHAAAGQTEQPTRPLKRRLAAAAVGSGPWPSSDHTHSRWSDPCGGQNLWSNPGGQRETIQERGDGMPRGRGR